MPRSHHREPEAKVDHNWPARVELVCDLVGLEDEVRPRVRPTVLYFLQWLYAARFAPPVMTAESVMACATVEERAKLAGFEELAVVVLNCALLDIRQGREPAWSREVLGPAAAEAALSRLGRIQAGMTELSGRVDALLNDADSRAVAHVA